MDYIVESLRALALPIESFVVDPQNARKHDERNLQAIEASLRRFGQRLPIVVQRNGMIVRAGNGRLAAALRLGWTHLAAVLVDDVDAHSAAFAIADNRTAELAEWDWEKFTEVLDQIRVDYPDLDMNELGFNEDELAGLSFAANWDALGEEREVLGGSREKIDKGTLVLKFTKEQSEKMLVRVRAAGLGDEVTAAAVFQLVKP